MAAAMSLQQLHKLHCTVVFSFVLLMVLHISGNTFGQGDETTLLGGSLSLYITRYLCFKKKKKKKYTIARPIYFGEAVPMTGTVLLVFT